MWVITTVKYPDDIWHNTAKAIYTTTKTNLDPGAFMFSKMCDGAIIFAIEVPDKETDK